MNISVLNSSCYGDLIGSLAVTLCCKCGKTHMSWQKKSCQNFVLYKASVQRARWELLERTADIKREETRPTVINQPTANTATDQRFTLVSHQKPEGGKRGPGRPRKQPLVPVTQEYLFAPSESSSRPQSTLFSTRVQGKDGDGNFNFT